MKEVVLGNFAIARGLLEAGLELFTAYPGTPSSEILPGVVYFSRKEGWDVYVEWSVNERVAVEVAFGASLSGKSSGAAMKQVGFNVALGAFLDLKDMPAEGGIVLCVADDPGPVSSQTEQDTRLLMRMMDVPILDPSSPSEARLFARLALELSRAIKGPVCVRPVGKVSHAREAIELHKRERETPQVSRGELLEYINSLGFVNYFIEGEGDLAVVASGMAFSVVRDVAEDMGLILPMFKVGSVHPFPGELLKRNLRGFKKVVVFEETDVVVEACVRELLDSEVLGRVSGHVPREGELSYDVIKKVLVGVLGLDGEGPEKGLRKEVEGLNLPIRPPRLCPGCGHRAAFFAAYKAFGDTAVYPGDIGCYTLGVHLKAVDTCLDMGGSVNMASGFSEASGGKTPVVASIGDSTFFHSGIDALLSARDRGYPFILMVLDNYTVAMTGFQPTPETGVGPYGDERRKVDLSRLLSSLGFSGEPVDPYDVPSLVEKFKELSGRGVQVVLVRRPCVLRYGERRKPREYVVEECTGCRACLRNFDCPSLYFDEGEKKVKVDPGTCVGCDVCLYACPVYVKKGVKGG